MTSSTSCARSQYMGVTPTKMKNAWTDAHLNNR